MAYGIWAIDDAEDGGYGLACPKWEGGWLVGPVSCPILSGPPGTKPEDHPRYKEIMAKWYGDKA